MGALMHTLHADQQRLEECAETIPGLLVMEFTAPAKSPRAELLMAINAEQRTQIEALQERNAVLSRRVADLSQEVRELKGEGLTPTRGCFFAHVPIPGTGGAKMLLELCPDEDERGVVSVHIGGRLVGVEDLIATLQSERDIGAAIDAWIAGERQAADESRAAAYAEDRR